MMLIHYVIPNSFPTYDQKLKSSSFSSKLNAETLTSNFYSPIEMLNLESYEHESYEYAKTITYNWIDYLKFSWINLLILIKIFMKLFYDSLVNLTKIFEEKKLKNISNQVALVTGGANGLGREIACRLAQEKCHIMICDVNYNEAIKTAEFIAEIYQVQTKAYKVDVSKFEEIQKLKNDIEQSFGPIDILINNAGIMPLFSLREGRPQDIQKIINVNFVSHFWVIYANCL